MTFFSHLRPEDTARFQALLNRAGGLGRCIQARLTALEAASPETAAAVRWLYAGSPLSDWANYDFNLFLACGSHGVFLRERSLLAQNVPEEIFLHYILPLRVNEEELCDCRRFFHDLLAPQLQGLSPREAVLAANYWCAAQVAYQSTDERTISALGAYRAAQGRCGEESTFVVNVLRAVGIPARQIYTPRWAHCDDNHAWVEVWVDGGWHFLGACEPEEVLDRGWFTNAASRAMVLHSRRFFPAAGEEELISQAGAVTFLNQLKRYAETTVLSVRVTDRQGAPVPDAEVTFGILNLSEFFPAASLRTGADGTVRLTCGLGSFRVLVRKNGIACERLIFTPDRNTLDIILEEESPVLDVWEDFVFTAPRDRIVRAAQPTEAQKALGREKAAAAAGQRVRRERPPTSADVFLAGKNFSAEEKQALLDTLSQKDLLDAPQEALREALETSRMYRASQDPALFYPYVACPRVYREPLRPHRQFILDYFTPSQKAAFRADPVNLWNYLQENIRFDSSLDYHQIVTLPVGALTLRNASPLSRNILFVSICRALGIPARLHPADRRAEYWTGRRFQAVDAPAESCTITLVKAPEESWQYGTDFALGTLEDGDYRTLDLSSLSWTDHRLVFPVRPGTYQILTDNRLPNGDLFASRYRFHLEAGEPRTIPLRKHQAGLSQMLASYNLEEFFVYDSAGQEVMGSELTRRSAVLLWLEEGTEPTEHLLNELLERREDFLRLPADLVFLVREPSALENVKLRQVMDAFPNIRLLYGRFVPNVETLARRMYVDHEKLPLIVVTTGPLHAVYASSGYNVGSGEMILKICGAARS